MRLVDWLGCLLDFLSCGLRKSNCEALKKAGLQDCDKEEEDECI